MFAGEVDLNTWYKPKIDKKILKDLSKRSDLKGIIDISIFGIALLFSGYLCLFHGAHGGLFQLYCFMVIFFIAKL